MGRIVASRIWERPVQALPVVLVIEDDETIQGIVEDALDEGGFEMAVAATGEEAITLIKGRQAHYRALVTDINLLGRIDGWEIARASRGVPNSILLTKPFAPAQLATAISNLLNTTPTA